jgi:hypothetical protein
MERPSAYCNNNNNDYGMRKIILLGLPKCGLTSFAQTFRDAGYNVAHWKTDNGEYVGELINQAYLEKKHLLHYLPEYNAFTQMDVVDKESGYCVFPTAQFYEQFYEQYPDALFILNYRPVFNHVRSICKWNDLQERLAYFGIINLSEWISCHNYTIRNYFKDKPNFIEFNIEKDPIEKISDVLGVPLTWHHLNKSNV